MGNDREPERDARRKGLQFMAEFFECASDMLRDEQRWCEGVEDEQAARRKEFDNKREEFEREWQIRNPRRT